MESPWTTARILRVLARFCGAAGAALGLVFFLVLTRLLDGQQKPDQLIRPLETIEIAALPAPPPPPDFEEPPPPPPPALPRLAVELNSNAPALKAVIDQRVDLTMISSEFSVEIAPPAVVPLARPVSAPRPVSVHTAPKSVPRAAVKSSYSVGELDGTPRLLNSPDVVYPSSLLRQGIREGRAVVEVAISTSGSVTVRSVISCSHPELGAMARSFASRARFSVPRKDGQAVVAVYRWPLILRP